MEDIRITMDDAPSFPQIPKIPLVMRLENQNMSDDFDPKVVSLGPYHHGKPELRFVEDFKPKSLEMFITGSDKDQDFLLEKILEEIEVTKSCYMEEFTSQYNDNDFARMMLLDGCFVLNLIETERQDCCFKVYNTILHLGIGVVSFIVRDMFLVENQVPFQVLKLLFNLRFGGDHGFEEMSKTYCYNVLFGQHEPKNNVSMDPQPAHLFEIFRRVVVHTTTTTIQDNLTTGVLEEVVSSRDQHITYSNVDSTNEQRRTTRVMDLISKGMNHCGCLDEKEEGDTITESSHAFHSVMELKSKGIHFMPSGFGSLLDVKLTSNYFYSKLSLPCWYISKYTRVFFRNMIAYETGPGKFDELPVSAYIYFMKTLIISPKDATELRRKKIIFNTLGSDEEVVQVFKALNTYGDEYPYIYKDVKEKLEQRFNNKSQTWIAELLDIYFRSPWSLLALVAATSLLFLTILQTYFASPFYSYVKKS
uniref:UPF0481 protein At3g47200-like n=1 Tax=Nicotiana tabacum TaxID=4097 RepID=A0A1S3ZIE5_TOBAC|nr:PREDICTED: UPF0481 protein At3g47200-like [Nicotiana tabacum]